MLQSRLTVAGDTLSTSAVSSTLSPPKKRISMICTLRASRRASAFIASSSATRSPVRSLVTTATSIERHQVTSSIAGHDGDIVEGDMPDAAPALYVMATGTVDQYAPHHLCRNREEMGPI